MKSFSVNEKRFYVPLDDVKAPCPKCSMPKSPNCDYISYPTFNEEFDLEFWCDDCGDDDADFEPFYFYHTVKLVCYLEVK